MRIFSTNRSFWKIIAGLVILTLGILLSVFLIKFSISDVSIWVFGKTVYGVVDEKGYELVDETAGELTFTYHAEYSFRTDDGERFTGITSLSAQEWSALIEGGDVKIVYSPFDPSNNRIDDSRFVPLLMCSYIPIILIAWFLLIQGWNLLYGEFKNAKEPHWSDERQAKSNTNTG